MKLNGKKIAFLGDSITEGVGTSGCPNRFCDLIEEATGAECLNYGISGTRIAIQTRPSEPSSFDRYFSSRVDDMDTDADIIFVFGGTNDFGHGDAPFGCMEDRTPVTFYGGLHDLFVRLIERYPGKPIVIATPLHRLGETCINGECKPKEVGTLLDYVQAIRRITPSLCLICLQSPVYNRVLICCEKSICQTAFIRTMRDIVSWRRRSSPFLKHAECWGDARGARVWEHCCLIYSEHIKRCLGLVCPGAGGRQTGSTTGGQKNGWNRRFLCSMTVKRELV